MTDTNGAKDQTRLTPQDATDRETVVPASGGSFGVAGDESGFGQHPVSSERREVGSDAAIDPSDTDLAGDSARDAYDGNIDLTEIDRDFSGEVGAAGAVPADGGTFGVVQDESGYRSSTGNPNAAPHGSGFSSPGEYGAFSPPAGAPAMAPPQYGTAAAASAKPDATAYAVAALGILAVLLTLLPSWAYIAAGVLGAAAIVFGVVRRREPGRWLANLGVIAGFIAVAIAVATVVVVYFA